MIQQYEEKLLSLIDEMVETASDDELFAGGYIRGHISLSAAQCEQEEQFSVDAMNTKVDESIATAQSELSPVDQVIVKQMWENLKMSADH